MKIIQWVIFINVLNIKIIVVSQLSYSDVQRIKEFIKARLDGKNAIVGVSGGIDSSVVLMLTSTALGVESVKAYFMPDEITPKYDFEDIEKLSKASGIEIETINIQPIVDVFRTVLNAKDERAIGNIKSRIRMVLLYYFANVYNGMVVGTTNKSEDLVGYFTKYGDGACDIEPIKHVYKNQVRQIASLIGVPESIINKKPSAGLWLYQTDEEELGISYDRLDEILRDLFDLNKGAITEEHKKVLNLFEKSNHKRRLPDWITN